MSTNKGALNPTEPHPRDPHSLHSVPSDQQADPQYAPTSHDYIEMTVQSPLGTNGNTTPAIEATAASGVGRAVVVDVNDGDQDDEQKCAKDEKSQRPTSAHVVYLSAAATLGASLRVFMGRFFGGDCEDALIDDFLTPASSQICVTSNGRSAQRGGALFRDLPANILGSFVMGTVSSPKIRIPWFNKDHPIQQDSLFHLMISTGFCGSLTTFASWNTQMVVMMDGTMTETGSQIVAALFGYLIGLMLPTSAFQFGRQVAVLMYSWKHTTASIDSGEEVASDQCTNRKGSCGEGHHPSRLLVLFASLSAITLIVLGFVVHDIRFYQSMILVLPLASTGALVRWKLSTWNSPQNRKACTRRLNWFPLGTWTANFVGATCSVACTAVIDRWTKLEGAAAMDSWLDAGLFAVAAGFAGSLSTVSSMVKEIVALAESSHHPEIGYMRSHLYAFLTLGSAIAISLVVYSSIVRME